MRIILNPIKAVKNGIKENAGKTRTKAGEVIGGKLSRRNFIKQVSTGVIQLLSNFTVINKGKSNAGSLNKKAIKVLKRELSGWEIWMCLWMIYTMNIQMKMIIVK